MAISSLDDLIGALPGQQRNFLKASATSEAAGQFHSLFLAAGQPGAGTAPSVGLNGETVTNSTAGAVPYTNAPGGDQNYLVRFEAAGATAGSLLLYDRLWQNSGIAVTTTTAQNITFSGLPSRDSAGGALGEDTELWIEVYTATTNGSAITNMTASYTNQAGTAGRTATVTSFPATAVAGTMVPFNLAAGDTGVRSVQSVTLGTSLGAGAVGLVVLRRLTMLPLSTANVGNVKDFAALGMPKLYDNTALFMSVLCSTTNTGLINGSLTIAGS